VKQRLRLLSRELDLSQPVLMGIVNATPDSFSDSQGPKDVDELAARARELLDDGAAIMDVGGESGRTDTEAVPVEEEISRVIPLVERLAADGALVSVDTWRGPVARAALDAGAAMINDVSGLTDESIAVACAETGAALVITHTRSAPKTKAFPEYDDVVLDARSFLEERMRAAEALGLAPEQIVLDPGIDLAKTPAQSVELLRRLPEFASLGRPLLLAVSRKDFVGALVSRGPRDRLAGTLAAVAHVVAHGAHMLRLHDVAEARDFLTVRAALSGELEPPIPLRLADELRREPDGKVRSLRTAKEARA
jgi:dihydropteroate synthase